MNKNFIIAPKINIDNRGYFENFSHLNNYFTPKQINHVLNLKKGTLRGMHMQLKPQNEKKILIVTQGCIFDVLVDFRKNSKNFLKKYIFKLNAESNYKILKIPRGFLHGYQTLTNNVNIIYFHEKKYFKKLAFTIRYDDLKLNIKWPLSISNISKNDLNGKSL